jgi:hypothetical protein
MLLPLVTEPLLLLLVPPPPLDIRPSTTAYGAPAPAAWSAPPPITTQLSYESYGAQQGQPPAYVARPTWQPAKPTIDTIDSWLQSPPPDFGGFPSKHKASQSSILNLPQAGDPSDVTKLCDCVKAFDGNASAG